MAKNNDSLNLNDVIELGLIIFVAAILTGALMPIALILLYNVSLTDVPTVVVVLYNLLGMALMIAIVVLFLQMSKKI